MGSNSLWIGLKDSSYLSKNYFWHAVAKNQLMAAAPSKKYSPIQFWSGFFPVNGGGHFNSNLSNSHSPSCSNHGIPFFQTNTLTLLLHLRLPRLLWSSSLPLALHFKLQRFSQNMPIIPPQYMAVPSHSISNLINIYEDHIHENNPWV